MGHAVYFEKKILILQEFLIANLKCNIMKSSVCFLFLHDIKYVRQGKFDTSQKSPVYETVLLAPIRETRKIVL